jgi:hypothetical protein
MIARPSMLLLEQIGPHDGVSDAGRLFRDAPHSDLGLNSTRLLRDNSNQWDNAVAYCEIRYPAGSPKGQQNSQSSKSCRKSTPTRQIDADHVMASNPVVKINGFV